MIADGNTVSVLLIDGENIPAKFAGKLAELVSEAGRDVIANVYGDFSGGGLNEWRDRAAKFGFRLYQTSGKPGGRNSADMLLALDAMDLMFTTDHWHFCIASGDGDFTALAIRLRAARRTVTGVGMGNASPAFRAACNRYEMLHDTVVTAPSLCPAGDMERHKDISLLFDDLLLAGLETDCDGWAVGSSIGTVMGTTYPGARWPEYGAATMKKAFSAHSAFEVVSDGLAFRVRRRKTFLNPAF